MAPSIPDSVSGPVNSPPTRRTIDVLTTLAGSPKGRTAAELARSCAITTSTCALILAELADAGWVSRDDDRRYRLGSGLFTLVQGLRSQFPMLDRGRDILAFLHQHLGAGCSMSRISDRHLTTVDTVGHGVDGERAVGQQFSIGPPFGLVAMAWRDDESVQSWLRGVTPALTRADIDGHRSVLAEVRSRGYGAWRFDDAHSALHDRLSAVLAAVEPTDRVARQLSALLTMVTLRSVTGSLEADLSTAEFVVLPIFGASGQPEYQVEIHMGGGPAMGFEEFDQILRAAQQLPGNGMAFPEGGDTG